MSDTAPQLESYASIVFDCDGVILDSNKVKTEAFRHAALPYGEAAAEALVEYHVANGGVSRYRKFEYFLQSIAGVENSGSALDKLLQDYAKAVRNGLLGCTIAPGLDRLRRRTPVADWFIVSGGDQAELRELFAERNIDEYFNGGIFGSPDTKTVIFARESEAGNIRRPALFIGDSRYDHDAAVAAGIDFVFLTGWSEFREIREYSARNTIPCFADISSLAARA